MIVLPVRDGPALLGPPSRFEVEEEEVVRLRFFWKKASGIFANYIYATPKTLSDADVEAKIENRKLLVKDAVDRRGKVVMMRWSWCQSLLLSFLGLCAVSALEEKGYTKLSFCTFLPHFFEPKLASRKSMLLHPDLLLQYSLNLFKIC